VGTRVAHRSVISRGNDVGPAASVASMSERPDGGRPSDVVRRSHGRASASSPVAPRAPYRLLSIIVLGTALFAALFAMFPSADDNLRRLDIVVASMLVVTAILVRTVAPVIPNGWGLDITLGTVVLIATYGSLSVLTSEGQILVGVGLVLFGVFSAYFRPRERMLVLLTLATVTYGLACLANPQVPRLLDWLAVMTVLWTASFMVSSLVLRLREQTLRDSLTGLLNRRGLELMADHIEAAVHRTDASVAVALLDLDDFKGYNDAHGHLAGDQLLIDLASAWESQLRGSDVLARFGGDEFALVLTVADGQCADELITRLRSAHPARWSVGVTTWLPREDLYHALSRADDALLASKRST
jgi:diguanylate cyclase (GGDEF)-like protein